MALEIIDINDMIAQQYEPKRAYRWVLGIDRRDLDAFTAKSWARPSFQLETITIDYINDKRFLAGKMTPQTITLTLYDPIAPSEAQKVQEWLDLHHEQITGRQGYAQIYKKELFLKMLDPAGVVVETWQLQGTFITSVNYGTLDYATNDPMTVELTLQYDKAILVN